VRHLVQHRLRAPRIRRAGDLTAEHILLEKRHGAGVFHRAGVEFRNEQLVVLAERVGHAEVLVIETEPLLGLREKPLGIHVFGQRRPAEDAQRDVAPLVGVGVVPAGVGPGDQRHQVGTHARRGDERAQLHAVAVGHRSGRAVGYDLPVRGRGDGDVERRLEIGLVEAREHPLGVGGFELRVQVHLVVDRIDEPVQALSGVRETAVGVDHHNVVLVKTGQRDAGGFVIAGYVDFETVEGRAPYIVRRDVDDGVGAGERIERHGGHGPEGAFAGRAVAVGEIQLDLVVVDGHQRSALDGLVAGQVRKCHAVQHIGSGNMRIPGAVVLNGRLFAPAREDR
jgi:hypothetical protein